jgi:hypothetical protein
MAEERMPGCLFTGDADSERCIRKALLYNAGELDNVLRHRESAWAESRQILEMERSSDKAEG